jgi:nudix-type nucleoside diphosphatase (YffH/AdpP family)
VYDRGNGSAILLYNSKQKTVILTRQFRLPTYLNENKSGMMIEVCAGLLTRIIPNNVLLENEEETGYRITKVEKVMETYMSPGAVTEILYLFTGEYDESMKVNDGGGVNMRRKILMLWKCLMTRHML